MMIEQKRTIAGLLGRTIWVIIAFGLAVALALIILLVLGSYSMGEELRGDYQPGDNMGYIVNLLSLLFGGASFLMVVTPVLTILPALLGVIVAEVIQVRNALYYLVTGGLSVAALPLLASTGDTGFNLQALTMFATAGFAGGLFYWLIAGRNA